VNKAKAKSIRIEFVKHSDQRYNTCGDYFSGPLFDQIKVSLLPDRREHLLVAIHELIEMALCESAWIDNKSIDDFDQTFEGEGEPGDDSNAPYYKQHQIATGIERLLAAEMGVDWLTYERHINELEYKQPIEPIDHDPTPWCQYCGARRSQDCRCGPIPEND
jgi:hypothetical protein